MVRSRASKKGVEMSLSALIGTILSILALYVLFNLFTSFLLSSSENQDIAEQNAKSIAEFVSNNLNNKYNDNQCFNSLKLIRLQNYQFEKENGDDSLNNYIYVLRDDGVYVYGYNYLTQIQSGEIEKSQATSKYCYNGEKRRPFTSCSENIQILNDVTEQKFSAILDFGLFSIGAGDNYISIISKPEDSYYALVPRFDNMHSYSTRFYDSEARYTRTSGPATYDSFDIDIQTGKEEVISSGNSLVFDTNLKGIFVPKGATSELIISQNICSFKQQYREDLLEFYKRNVDKIDFYNNKIIIKYTNDPISFEWNNGFKCYDQNQEVLCSNVHEDLFSRPDQIGYKDFISTTKTYYSQKHTNYNEENWYIDSIDSVSYQELRNRENIPLFSEVFTKASTQIPKFDDDEWMETNTRSLTNRFGWNNIEFNNNENIESNTVIIENGFANFYAQNPDNGIHYYYSFRHDYLRKDKECSRMEECSIYYVGALGDKRVELKQEPSDESLLIIRDLPIRINNNIREYDIVLTKVQYNAIPELRGEE